MSSTSCGLDVLCFRLQKIQVCLSAAVVLLQKSVPDHFCMDGHIMLECLQIKIELMLAHWDENLGPADVVEQNECVKLLSCCNHLKDTGSSQPLCINEISLCLRKIESIQCDWLDDHHQTEFSAQESLIIPPKLMIPFCVSNHC